MSEPLDATGALRLVADGLDVAAVGPVADRPLVAVALHDEGADDEEVARLVALLRPSPVVLVGVAADPAGVAPSAVGLDLLLCPQPDAPRPWVGCPDGVAPELARLEAAAVASPAAAGALAQLLRLGEGGSAVDAVVAESWVYGLLQAGSHHRSWLDRRAGRARRPRPDGPVVAVDRHDGELGIALDRPEVRNAYGARMRDELVAALQIAALDPTVEVVELRGNGPAFCSGGDLDEFGLALDVADAHAVRTTRNAGIEVHRLRDRVVAYVHGPCVGAGVELPAFAGRVVAHPDATFRLPEVAMGLVPGAGGTASIPRRVGRHRCVHLALRGEPVDAATAVAWGLVDAVDATAFPSVEPTVGPGPADDRPAADPTAADPTAVRPGSATPGTDARRRGANP